MKNTLRLAAFAAVVFGYASASMAVNTVNDYIKDGLLAHWDGEYNQGLNQPHDSSATTWIDLSGNGFTAAKTSAYSEWGANYLSFVNPSTGEGLGRYDYTPSQAFLSAINTGVFSYQVVYKIDTWVTDNGIIGCRDNGGTWGFRGDGSGNGYFAVAGTENGVGTYKQKWLDGCVFSIGANGKSYAALFNDNTLPHWNSTIKIGGNPTKGNGRIGASCAMYSNQCKGRIYAGRIYSRELKGVELAYNASIDRVRYFNDSPRTTYRVSSYGYPVNERYGSPSPAYDTLSTKADGATQIFSIASSLQTYDFDGARAYRVNDKSRAVYLGATITQIASDGTESSANYTAENENLGEQTIDSDKFVVWKWNKQYEIIATAQNGGKIKIGADGEWLSSYTNWYDAVANQEITVVAEADENWVFNGWTGDVTGDPAQTSTTVTMNQGRSIAATFVRVGTGDGSTYYWKGGSSDSFVDAANWVGGLAPLETDHVVITSTVAQTIQISAATPHYASFTIGGGPAKTTVKLKNWSTAINADVVTIANNGVLSPDSCFTDLVMSNRVHVVCDTFTLAEGGKIEASGCGWRGDTTTGNTWGCGPGKGQDDRGGAGYGGLGTGGYGTLKANAGLVYGSLMAPEQPGSGGGRSGSVGGAGGGAVRLEVAGHLTVNGDIRADGESANDSRGGGAGGGIYLTCATFEGTGKITAIGGSVKSTGAGGGGGGRIAIVWSDTNGQKAYSPAPLLNAGVRGFGESNGCYPPNNRQLNCKELYHYVGKRGTVFLTDDSFHPGTIWNKCAGEFHYGTRTHSSLTISREPFVPENATDTTKLAQDVYFANMTVDIPDGLILPRYAHLTLSNCTVTARSLAVTNGCFELLGNSTLTVSGDIIAAGSGRLNFESGPTNGVMAETWNKYGQKVTIGGRLLLADSSVLYPASDRINGGSVSFELGSLVVESDAKIDGNTRGWGKWTASSTSKIGGGPGGYNTYSGAAYGGAGGGAQRNTATYGDMQQPTLPGSEGGYNSTSGYIGGYGGGLFWATVAGRAQIDGIVRMTGGNSGSTQGSGGSGGAVCLKCNRLVGQGSITAIGGSGGSGTSYSGCGGGGRIAIDCHGMSGWTGTISAAPGNSSYTYKYAATEGTIYVKVHGGTMVIVK